MQNLLFTTCFVQVIFKFTELKPMNLLVSSNWVNKRIADLFELYLMQNL